MGILGVIPLRCPQTGDSLVDDYEILLTFTLIYYLKLVAGWKAGREAGRKARPKAGREVGRKAERGLLKSQARGECFPLDFRADRCTSIPSKALSET